MDLDFETDTVDAPGELSMPLLADFQSAMAAVRMPPGGSAEVAIRSKGRVLYRHHEGNDWLFVSESVLD